MQDSTELQLRLRNEICSLERANDPSIEALVEMLANVERSLADAPASRRLRALRSLAHSIARLGTSTSPERSDDSDGNLSSNEEVAVSTPSPRESDSPPPPPHAASASLSMLQPDAVAGVAAKPATTSTPSLSLPPSPLLPSLTADTAGSPTQHQDVKEKEQKLVNVNNIKLNLNVVATEDSVCVLRTRLLELERVLRLTHDLLDEPSPSPSALPLSPRGAHAEADAAAAATSSASAHLFRGLLSALGTDRFLGVRSLGSGVALSRLSSMCTRNVSF